MGIWSMQGLPAAEVRVARTARTRWWETLPVAGVVVGLAPAVGVVGGDDEALAVDGADGERQANGAQGVHAVEAAHLRDEQVTHLSGPQALHDGEEGGVGYGAGRVAGGEHLLEHGLDVAGRAAVGEQTVEAGHDDVGQGNADPTRVTGVAKAADAAP
jgi:hypothetical protein